ncbi:response regulator transcription factor [Methylophaga sp. OBS3]|uniref:response regulator transcription factor n=1 Tax=Methylophaga sp. OBS3 TaxID=2991934 RepID=UPI00224FA915|nr:response regulator transcription factor [Methylophaga sp. OBS3]MCX4190031.1 response regulator transcription factor [Methylophaga sp. OBS3]
MEYSILIIEDDQVLNDQLKQMLTKAGFSVWQSHDAYSVTTILSSHTIHLVLLDLTLPDSCGHDLLQQIRQQSDVPVILITARNAQSERILGLQNGADDFLGKPFNFLELQLRIEAVLRRSSQHTQSQEPNRLTLGPLRLQKQPYSVVYNQQEITLTTVQFKLLWTLARHYQQPLSKAELYRRVLLKDFSRYDRSLDMHISRVRRKLVAAGMPADKLLTVHGTGYCLQ